MGLSRHWEKFDPPFFCCLQWRAGGVNTPTDGLSQSKPIQGTLAQLIGYRRLRSPVELNVHFEHEMAGRGNKNKRRDDRLRVTRPNGLPSSARAVTSSFCVVPIAPPNKNKKHFFLNYRVFFFFELMVLLVLLCRHTLPSIMTWMCVTCIFVCLWLIVWDSIVWFGVELKFELNT